MVEKINIDDSELSGMSPQTCYTLGFEYGFIYGWIKAQPSLGEYTFTIHEQNGEKVETLILMTKIGFEFEFEYKIKKIGDGLVSISISVVPKNKK